MQAQAKKNYICLKLIAMRIYAEGNMVRFDTDAGVCFKSLPKGSIGLAVQEPTKIAFTNTDGIVFIVLALADIKNSGGTAYGTLAQTITALNGLLA